jgi:hypothetical protein
MVFGVIFSLGAVPKILQGIMLVAIPPEVLRLSPQDYKDLGTIKQWLSIALIGLCSTGSPFIGMLAFVFGESAAHEAIMLSSFTTHL